ncbi:AAA ATPase forming ring-shaped complexes like [Actinidia chinensis var. chinensis]|uniref:AAA ATPase forming ring-shaped complexes like n=1 Tax=Actinidia chinensis var. chinensis TaxID=1590841 RepID=A0A2R6PCV8_ACTCC|nr:AAA ATPase forming ring-shaped complexes like [Actinidia chinensis var. chinensis]
MDCLILPVSILTRRCSGYRQLSGDVFGGSDDPVTVVVGKERREFVVDPFVLDENPFRVLIEMLKEDKKGRVEIQSNKRVVFVDVDAILFEHMLWLMHNDWASLLQLNMREIVDFYAQDI